jgi:proteasome assembly chaperone (PAC2) family protein
LAELQVSEQPALKDTVLIAAWAGWPDAAESATRAVRELIRQLRAVKFATIDPEEFYVFTERRPVVSNGPRGKRQLNWPANEFYYHRAASGKGRDILLMVGVEPDLRWSAYTGHVSTIARANDTRIIVTVGALLDSVPHTRAPRVMGTTTSDSLGPEFEGIKYLRPNYEGPSGITSATIDVFSRHNIPSVSVWGHAPHYLQVTYNPTITMAILKELQKFIPARLDLSGLEKESADFDKNLSSALEGQRELAAYVQKLEERFDSEEEARRSPEPRELMAELEEFLRRQRSDSGDGEEGPGS